MRYKYGWPYPFGHQRWGWWIVSSGISAEDRWTVFAPDPAMGKLFVKWIGVPVKLGAKSIEQIIEIKLTAEGKAGLDKSAAAVKELCGVIGV